MTSRRTRHLTAFLLAGALLCGTAPVSAQEAEPAPDTELPENPYERLAEVRRRQAEAAFEVENLQTSALEVQARLATVQSWVNAQEQVVGAAQAELVRATLASDRATRRQEAKAAERDELEALMVEIAIEAYMRPPNVAALDVVLTQDLAAGEKADVMLRAKAQRDKQVAQELAAAEKALRRLRVDAEVETSRAEGAAEQAAQALDELHSAQLEQVGLAERIKVDLAATSQSLELLGGAEFEAVTAARRETEALLARIGRGTSVPLTQVRGFRVHSDIAPAIEALLADAEADGIVLAGWGYRSTEQQVSLRRQHCGGEGVSDADAVYGRPASACSPPTAKPGSSMHELGLAIDFTHDGASIGSHDSPAFQWLAAYAGDYGLRNLPSEPWHWSVNGD